MKIFDKNFLGVTGDSLFYIVNNTGTIDGKCTIEELSNYIKVSASLISQSTTTTSGIVKLGTKDDWATPLVDSTNAQTVESILQGLSTASSFIPNSNYLNAPGVLFRDWINISGKSDNSAFIRFYANGMSTPTSKYRAGFNHTNGAFCILDETKSNNGLNLLVTDNTSTTMSVTNGGVVFNTSPKAPTPATSDSSTTLATTAYVNNKIISTSSKNRPALINSTSITIPYNTDYISNVDGTLVVSSLDVPNISLPTYGRILILYGSSVSDVVDIYFSLFSINTVLPIISGQLIRIIMYNSSTNQELTVTQVNQLMKFKLYPNIIT